MKFFSVLCVVIVAVLLENAVADPDPEPKSNSKESGSNNVAPEDAINLMLFNGPRQNTTYSLRTFTRMLQNPQFNRALPTVVFFHCMDQTYLEQTMTDYVETFLRQGDYNVLIYDWTYYTRGSSNLDSLPDLQMLGETSARYMLDLLRGGYTELFYFVGLGVGANVAGSVAREVSKGSDRTYRIGRLTALDPFMPTNYAYGNMKLVNIDDGIFVDMVHTDGRSERYNGNVDFYPNGGKTQPGCKRTSSKSKDSSTSDCSHYRAWLYYKESVNNPRSFLSKKCRSNSKCNLSIDAYMGFNASPRLTGGYYLRTNDRSPYSKSSKSNKSSSKSMDSSSSSSSSSEESNEMNQNSRNNYNQKNKSGSNESMRNGVRQNMDRNMSGSRSNERNQSNQRNVSNERQTQDQRRNQAGRSNENNQRWGSNERYNQNQRSNSNDRNQGERLNDSINNQGYYGRNNNQNQRVNSNERRNQDQWRQNQGARSNEMGNNQVRGSNERINQNQRGNNQGLFPDYSRFRNNNNENYGRSVDQQRDYYRN